MKECNYGYCNGETEKFCQACGDILNPCNYCGGTYTKLNDVYCAFDKHYCCLTCLYDYACSSAYNYELGLRSCTNVKK